MSQVDRTSPEPLLEEVVKMTNYAIEELRKKKLAEDDMEILLDIRDQHLDSMEIRPEDQLNLFKALRFYKETMGKMEKIIDTRKRMNANLASKNESSLSTIQENTTSIRTMESDTKNSFHTVNLNNEAREVIV